MSERVYNAGDQNNSSDLAESLCKLLEVIHPQNTRGYAYIPITPHDTSKPGGTFALGNLATDLEVGKIVVDDNGSRFIFWPNIGVHGRGFFGLQEGLTFFAKWSAGVDGSFRLVLCGEYEGNSYWDVLVEGEWVAHVVADSPEDSYPEVVEIALEPHEVLSKTREGAALGKKGSYCQHWARHGHEVAH